MEYLKYVSRILIQPDSTWTKSFLKYIFIVQLPGSFSI